VQVLHVYRTYYPDTQGGLEEVIRQICINTAGFGIVSRVLTLTGTRGRLLVRQPEARVYRAFRSFEVASCGVSVQAVRLYRRLAREADVIHYHFPWPFADLLHLSAPPRAATLVTYHSDIVRQRVLGAMYAPLMHRFLGSMHRIVCTSPNYFATSRVLPRYQGNVEVIPIGLNEDAHPDPDDALLADVAVQYGHDFFLFVGVLRYYKGLHVLLNALSGAPYRVVIVGSGPSERALKRQAATLGLTNVVFAGHVNDAVKAALFRNCLGVVFPSHLRSEAFGVTLLEGAMYGRPLISTEIGSGTSYVNLNGVTGLVVDPASPRALRSAMDRLYGEPALAEAMGQGARNRYQELFTGTKMGARYAELYERLISERTPRPAADPAKA
jgi:glycosyltransferase involved in cell wall biosynthesis